LSRFKVHDRRRDPANCAKNQEIQENISVPTRIKNWPSPNIMWRPKRENAA